MRKRLLSDEQRRDWLRLIQTENVGPVAFRQLINRYGGASEAIEALPELSRRGGLSRPLRVYAAEKAEQHLVRAQELGAAFVVPGEDGYPPLLREVDGAPPLLCVKGDASVAMRDAVAIVGARNASAIGRRFARQLASELGQAGYAVASGLARGIDAAAHEAALETGTAAVVAGGIDYIYPAENADLMAEIGARGILISEMMPGMVPRAEHFPRRNRIISGMSLAVIVVEAAMRSGSLITARLGAEQGREVFAVPGSPLDPRAEGSNRLIREGATLLTSAQDVIDALSQQSPRPPRELFLEPQAESAQAEDVSKDERQRIITLLSPSPTDIDDIIRESGIAPAAVVGVLLELELAGKLVRHGSQKVSLT
jgi:DNA processing protein